MDKFLFGLNIIDIIFIVCMTLGLFIGARRGLAVMISKVIALIGSVLISLRFYVVSAAWISKNTFLPTKTAEVSMLVILYLLSWALLNLVLKIIHKFMEVNFSNGISRFGGFLLGGAWFYFFLSFVMYVLLLFQAPFLQFAWVEQSFVAPSAVNAPLFVYKMIFQSLPPEPTL